MVSPALLKVPFMNIIQHFLPLDDYFQEACEKRLVVLHHTVGASVESSMRYWDADPRKVATAFVIERDGTIYQTFPAKMWAYHIGLGNRDLEMGSIGIELASEGGLTERNGLLYKFGIVGPRTQYTGQVYDHGKEWRGFRYFAAYTEDQVKSAISLALFLCDEFGIEPHPSLDHATYDPSAIHDHGITSHAVLRRDKSDLHPGFPWQLLIEEAHR